MEPRYLKSCTWLIELPYTSSGGCGQQLIAIYSVLGALMTSPRSAAALAVLVSWDWAREIKDSSKGMSSEKSKSFKTFAGYLLYLRGHVRTPESPSEDLSSR